MPVAFRHRENEEREEQDERHVNRAQVLGAHDGVGGIQVEERHDDRHGGDESRERARQLVLDALFALDHFLGAPERFLAYLSGGLVQPLDFLAHRSPSKRKSPASALAGLDGTLCTQLALILTPFSAKYFTAPGCQGIGEASAFCESSLMFSASLCTRISSSRLSKMVLTMV